MKTKNKPATGKIIQDPSYRWDDWKRIDTITPEEAEAKGVKIPAYNKDGVVVGNLCYENHDFHIAVFEWID